MMPMAVPRANSAEMIGRRAAKKEPKTNSSTTQGEEHAEPVLLNDWLLAFSARWPVSATVRPSLEACRDDVDEILRLGVRDVVGQLVEGDLEQADGPVRVDVRRVDEVARRVVGTGTRESRWAAALISSTIVLMRMPDGGVGQAGAARGAEDHLLGVARCAGATDLSRLMASRGLGVGEVEVVGEVGADRL